MGNNHDYIALDWVRGEIKQTLAQARIALEAFVEDNEDKSQMTFCLNHIHQVYGTLQMVEFYGASLLAEEMEKLCQSILEDKVANLQDAFEVLMSSLLQLENYLEHIQMGHRDLPVILLPILNDLRALQGQPLLSDTSLFTPDLSAAEVSYDADHNLRMQDPQVVANLRKLRQMFQFSLAGIVRNQDLAINFGYLYKVVARLEKFCQGTPIGIIWRVAVGFLDSIQGNPNGLSSAPKQLLRDLDHQIKLMIEDSHTILSKPLPADLLKNLLYYIARTDVKSSRIQNLKAAFRLDQALPTQQEVDEERQKLHGPGRETMASVVAALSDELNQIKDRLDLYVRGDTKDSSELTELIAPLNQIANTMAILGLGVARKVVLDQITKIEQLSLSLEPPDDKLFMDMAGALLYVEANLVSLTHDHQTAPTQETTEDGGFVVPAEHFESAHKAVIFESRNGLEQAKNGIINFIASQWDHSEIEDVPDLLDSIRGGLQIIPLPQAAKLLGACSRYIRQSLLIEKTVPDWQQLDRLADAITSIEYYLERLAEGSKDNERILKVAEESVARLGLSTKEPGAHSLQPDDANEPTVVSQHHVSDVASESPDAVVKESDKGLIDDEILEIFVEEAAEVMESIVAAMVRIKANNEDLDALKELRRAFHTLKGSGRLVGAKVLGELGWSVENLLNKYLDKSRPVTHEVIDFLDAVVERLPRLTEDFSKQRESANFEHLVGRAELLTEQLLTGGKAPAGFVADREETILDSESESESEAETDQELQAAQPPLLELTEQIEDDFDTELAEDLEPESEVELERPSESIERDTVEDEDDLIDEEILEIFIEEAGEVLATMNVYLPTFMTEFDNKEAITELRRAFHTLKGSGRMVGAEVIGETAWAVENMLNRVIDGSILLNQDIAELVAHAVQVIPELVEAFEAHTTPTTDVALIQKQAAALANGDFVQSLKTQSQKPIAEVLEVSGEQGDAFDDASIGIDEVLLEIFETEANTHVQTIEDFVGDIGEGFSAPIDDAISRALHTLKGSANTANIMPIAKVAIPVEKFIKEARANNLEVTYPIAKMLTQAMALVRAGVEQLTTEPQKVIPGTEQFLASLTALQKELLRDLPEDKELVEAAYDPQVINIFLTEGLDILLDAEHILGEWSDNPVPGEALVKLVSEVKTLHRGAKVAGLDHIAELCECLEECYASIDIGTQLPSSAFLNAIKRGHDALIDMMDQLAAGLTVAVDNKLLAELRSHIVALSQVKEQGETKEQGHEVSADGLNESLAELERHLDGVLPSYSVTEEVPEESLVAAEEVDQTGLEAPHNELMLDPDLVDIFLEEAQEIVISIQPGLAQLRANPASENILIQLQRDLHTLKGGARLAGIAAIGDLSDAIERIFERLVDRKLVPSALLLDHLETAEQALTAMLGSVEAGQTCESCETLIHKLQQAAADDYATQVTELPSAELEVPDVDRAPQEFSSEEEYQLDPELTEIFLEEAKDIIHTSGTLLHEWESATDDLEVVGRLQRELHTLKGGARMAEIASIGDLAHELETLFELIVESRFAVSPAMISLCLSCHDALANMVDSVSENGVALPADELLTQIKHVLKTGQVDLTEKSEPETDSRANVAPMAEPAVKDKAVLDDDLLSLFLDESKDILAVAACCLDLWREDQEGTDGVLELQREMHTLTGGARLASVDPVADLADAVNQRLEQLIDGQVPDSKALLISVSKAYQEMTEMLERLIHREPVIDATDLIEELSNAGGKARKAFANELEQLSPAATAADHLSLLGNIEGVDLEVVEMFIEEAGELIEALEEQLSGWSKAPSDDAYNLEIQRILHTLKGGARLSNLAVLADESHALETQLVDAIANKVSYEGSFKEAVLAKHDLLLKLVDEIQRIPGVAETPFLVPRASEDRRHPAETSVPALDEQQEWLSESELKAKQNAAALKHEPGSKAPPQETIRVSASLLESLVNLAGETSISRGRLEQQISDFGFTLEEMSATIERLREQLRRMEMETEAQVFFSVEKEGLGAPDYSDFDPLEMDRYSSIQQLSRALTESTSDLLELRDTLANRARDSETLLLQQSRINSELQEGLMKTRMIPFSFMVPRLRRIVRQIGGELKKQVEFDVTNAEGEMDRSVLERMVAPLEHMLRNALDHGIESVAERQKLGKPVTGTITLGLSREGGDVVLKMKDDGAGINTERILQKAHSQGLIKKKAKLTQHEILQFIMLPGFSTAQQVTQISGRGVGMDVVASEIKQLGGSIAIASVLGQGTEFTVRLPFTVSVNRALMVNLGDDFYAIPLNTIEGIVRVSPYELEEYYKPDAPLYEYAGRKYKLQYLGKLLHSSHQPKLQGQPLPLPVILVRTAENPMALQVDSLMGSREIVVKSLGHQFSGVHGVSGATILGDGSVVVILDLPALIRDETTVQLEKVITVDVVPVKRQQTKLVMVVDDSVTVRKVTSRLLERNGMDVITAKDGVDAIALLQDYKPDVMLLDIEMPRMDGFEVATLVRHDERLKDVPIIMITSRTGQKHRERALSIGVNEYLGKPFQEQDLLDNIERLTN